MDGKQVETGEKVDRPTDDLHPPINKGVSSLSVTTKSEQVSVDWLTCTTHNRSIGLQWFDIWRKIMEKNGAEFARSWSWKGYDGGSTEGARWGVGAAGWILIVSGNRAQEVWKNLRPAETRVTRLDLAVTIELEAREVGLARAHYNAIGDEERQRKYSFVENSKGGQTLYVGSRSSDHYGRMYDKGAEQKDAAGWRYRYEIVLKKPYATKMLKRLLEKSETKNGYIETMTDAKAFVWDWFDARQVTPVFLRSSADKIVLETDYTVTTEERTLQWIQRSVSPAIQKLLRGGRREDVINILRLEDFMDKPPKHAP
ncbi:MAG: replication initiation factor domain-containing protein [Nitrososphaera sp.]|nr:replication initiation factor domain-containing protein [Nitrososphaera sp.]